MRFENSNFFIKDPEILRNARLGMGLMCLFASLHELYFGNPERLSTGRWSWLYRGVTEIFGPHGYSIFYLLIGLSFIAWAFIAWSRRDSSTK